MTPVVGSLWRHIGSGAVFTVTGVYNLNANKPGFPILVAYSGQSLRAWCEPLAVFRREMEPASANEIRPWHLAPGERLHVEQSQ